MKVFVVDDAKFMRLSLLTIFQKNNITVIGETENGKEAF